jgi:hypothetical protein
MLCRFPRQRINTPKLGRGRAPIERLNRAQSLDLVLCLTYLEDAKAVANLAFRNRFFCSVLILVKYL